MASRDSYENLMDLKEALFHRIDKWFNNLQPGERKHWRSVKEEMKMLMYDHEKDYFMSIASLAALRSKDPWTAVGACIVDPDKKVVGIGYNSMPHDKDDEFPWSRSVSKCTAHQFSTSSKKYLCKETKYPFVCHAALNAIVNRTIPNLDGCTIYLTLHPDDDCAHLIVRSGIKEVLYDGTITSSRIGANIYDSKNDELIKFINARDILLQGRVSLRKYTSKIAIELTKSQQQVPPLTLEKRLEQGDSFGNRLRKDLFIAEDDLFMGLALLEKKFINVNDKKPRSKQGACIVSKSGQILAIGGSLSPEVDHDTMETKVERIGVSSHGDPYVCHAEYNVITSYRGVESLKGCALYVTLSPCNVCAKLIAQARLEKVIYRDEYDNDIPNEECNYKLTEKIFKACAITFTRTPSNYDVKIAIKKCSPRRRASCPGRIISDMPHHRRSASCPGTFHHLRSLAN